MVILPFWTSGGIRGRGDQRSYPLWPLTDPDVPDSGIRLLGIQNTSMWSRLRATMLVEPAAATSGGLLEKSGCQSGAAGAAGGGGGGGGGISGGMVVTLTYSEQVR